MALKIITAALNWDFEYKKPIEYTYIVDTTATINNNDWFIFIGKSLCCAESDTTIESYLPANKEPRIRVHGINNYLPANASVKIIATNNPFCKSTLEEYYYKHNFKSFTEWCTQQNIVPKPITETRTTKNLRGFKLKSLVEYKY